METIGAVTAQGAIEFLIAFASSSIPVETRRLKKGQGARCDFGIWNAVVIFWNTGIFENSSYHMLSIPYVHIISHIILHYIYIYRILDIDMILPNMFGYVLQLETSINLIIDTDRKLVCFASRQCR